jgi:hypothetical protein
MSEEVKQDAASTPDAAESKAAEPKTSFQYEMNCISGSNVRRSVGTYDDSWTRDQILSDLYNRYGTGFLITECTLA